MGAGTGLADARRKAGATSAPLPTGGYQLTANDNKRGDEGFELHRRSREIERVVDNAGANEQLKEKGPSTVLK